LAKILIIDDEAAICKLLALPIRKHHHHVTSALTLTEGMALAVNEDFDVIFLDVNLPDGNGLEALTKFKSVPSSPDIIIITGAGTPDGAELAIRSGAWTYIQKPPLMSDIILQLNRVLQYRTEKEQRLRPAVLKREGIVGSSPELEACLAEVAQVAGSDVNVLITGETGTGKELFAKTIHNNSFRSNKPFVVVDCASLPDHLVNSMLFGHTKGSFTGAQKDRSGLIKEADGGTLFLDEVGELSLEHQKEFLRVLQENRFRPIGSNREVESDFRLIAATNRDLNQMVKSGHFRKDLLYRIQSFNIHLPPLKSRPQDIKAMAQYWINRLCDNQGIETKGFSPDFFEALISYDWPGNFRELIHTMERVFAVARFDPTLFSRHLPTKIRVHQVRSLVNNNEDHDDSRLSEKKAFVNQTLSEVRDAALAEVERNYLINLMAHTQGKMKDAIRISGLSQSRLYSLMKKYQIPRS
jgi:two-component system NtrC family response regulator